MITRYTDKYFNWEIIQIKVKLQYLVPLNQF